MFGFSIRTRQNVADSPKAPGSPGTFGSPRPVGTPRATGSPKTEVVREIDTRAPFQSVKAAVSLFGEGASPKAKPLLKKSKTPEERVLEKETQLHLTLIELDKFKEQLKNAETTKSQAVEELGKANRTIQELTCKLETVSESKQAAIEATEAAKNRAQLLEESKSSKPIQSDGVWDQDEDAERKYKAYAGEVISAKQELTNLRQDFDTALAAKLAAFQEAADAQHNTKVNHERLTELSKETATMHETLVQVKFAAVKAQKEQSELMEEAATSLQSHKTAKEKVENKIRALKEEFDGPELAGNLEDKLEETTEAIGVLQEQLQNVHASDLDSLRTANLELDDAKKILQEVLEEKGSLGSSVESLYLEMENVKRDISEMEARESKTESRTVSLLVEIEESKAELEAALVGETKAGDTSDEMHLKLEELSSEAENAKQETAEINRNAEELKKEAEISTIAAKEAEEKLQIALKEAEEVKAAEKLANDQMHNLSTRTDDARATNSGSNGMIKLSTEEFESLTRKVKELGNAADMKVATTMAQVEAISVSQKAAFNKLEECLKESEDIDAATKDALKIAEKAEAAKQAVEAELQKWREKEQIM